MYKKLYIILLYFIIIFLFNVFLLPLSPRMPGSGLDQSWIYVNSYAFENNLKYGSEIVFNYGPLSSFSFGCWNTLYHPTYYYLLIVFSFITTSLMAIGITNHILKANAVAGFISLLSVFVGITNGLSYYFVVPFLFSTYVIQEDTRSRIFVYIFIFLSAFASLIKFSYFLPMLSVILLFDCYFIIKFRKVQFYTITFAIFFIFLYLLAGQNISDIGLYIKGSLELTQGHTEAMQVAGPKGEIYYWIAIGVIGIILPLYIYVRGKNIDKTIVLFSFIIVLFMMFKAGFVRHDGAHNRDAFAGLNFFFGFMLPLTFQKKISKTYIALLLLALIAIFFSVQVNSNPIGSSVNTRFINHYKTNFINRLNNLNAFYKAGYQKKLLTSYNQSIEEIKKEQPLPEIEGTIDIYPWDQAYIIAHNLEYRPRPVFQSYVVYTEYLINRNIEFLKSDFSPMNILFKIEELDDRFPGFMEGASWIEILRQYKMENIYGNFLHLIKDKKIDRSSKLEKFLERALDFGENIELPDEIKDDFVYANIKIEKSVLGKILNTLYKVPRPYMVLYFQDGHSERFGIISEISKMGFILSPAVSNINDFIKLSSSNSFFPKSKRVKSIRFEADDYRDLFYKKIHLTINKLELKDVGTININISNFKNFFILDEMLSKTVSPHNASIRNYNYRPVLHAPMPSKTTLSLDNIKKINFGYGIVERPYTEDNITDACFSISAVYKHEHKEIWRRCIDPSKTEQDRKTQYASVSIDNNTEELIFEIRSNETGNRKLSWTYWSDISF